jgi:two-component system cell cycle sensor histidine kinase/response regulator CckA
MADRTRPTDEGAGRRRDPLAMTPFERAWLLDRAPAPAQQPSTGTRRPRHAADPAAAVPLDAVGEALAVVDRDGLIVRVNGAFERLVGATAHTLEGAPLERWIAAPPAAAADPLAPPSPHPRRTASYTRDGGETCPAEVHIAALDTPGWALVTVRDGRDQTRLEAALQDNRDLTEQLRRSQKIGALGRLAGGVAHDFNNLLQVIGGQAEALGQPGLDARAQRRLLRSIQTATERAGSLTRQLLAFGRRQILMPEVLDLNVTVRTLERMLTRVIGEDVQLVSTLAPDLAAVGVDPGQIEQVVLNLAINARDAMTDGGTLEIATSNFVLEEPWAHASLPVRVPAGAWVLLSVRDTGCGMDHDTAAQAFEPFFTTKDSSKGSGLGLSMVYGIVKQSGGYTWIDTAPGAGTAVHVLLPAVAETAGAPRVTSADPVPAPPRAAAGGATVLLVEDDPEVRGLFSKFLEAAGHTVIEATDGRDALETFDARGADIDLVVTDVVMPNVSGPALTSAIRARRPDVKVLFVSGYADELEAGTAHAPHTVLVHKPITRQVLVDNVAALLKGDTGA